MADRRVSVKLDADVSEFIRGMVTASAATKAFEKSMKDSSPTLVKQENQIDRLSGRLRLFGETAVTLGPALVPLGGASVTALAGLTSGFIAAGSAAGVALAAFQGIGDGLKSLDAYQLEPTTANLEKMQDAFNGLGPAGANFVRFLDSLEPDLKALQNTARDGFLPGLEDGITSLMTRFPQVRQIVANLSDEMGRLAESAGEALAGPQFDDFFNFLETEAAPTLRDFSVSLGNVIEGFGHLLAAFAPMSHDFSKGLVDLTNRFAAWTDQLSQTNGFREFVAYLKDSGPAAVEFMGALGNAFVGVIKATAPFGQTVLPILTEFLRLVSAVANSPIGAPLFTAAAGFIAVSRAATVATGAVTRFNAASAGLGAGKVGLASKVAGIAAAFGILGNEFAKLNGSEVDMSELDANLNSIAEGGGADALDHLTNSLSALSDSMPDAYEIPTLGGIFGDTPKDNAAQYVEAYDQALASLVASGNAEKAATIFAQIQEARTGLSADTHQFAPFGESAKTFDAYAAALAAAASSTDGYAAANGRAAGSANKSRAAIRGLVSAMEEQTSAALGAFDAVTQYNRALDAARAQARKSEAGIDAATEAGRKNRDALSQLAGAWNNQSDAVRNNVDKFHEARKAFIETATAMGVPIERAKQLAAKLMEIPKSVVTNVSANTSEASARIQGIINGIASIHDKTVTITTLTNANVAEAVTRGSHRATGGPIYGPGTKTSDSVPVMASRGEFMMSAAAVDHYGLGTMFAMNARHLAGGGDVDGKAFRSADRSFNLSGSMTTRDMVRSLRDFERAIDKAGGRVGKSFDALGKRAIVLSDRYDEAQDKIARLRELRSTVQDSFNNDAFGGSLADFQTQVKADRNDATSMAQALRKAGKRGLDGPLFEALAASGNLLLTQQFAHLSKGQIRQQEKLYGSRTAAQGDLGKAVVTIAGMTETQKEIRQMSKAIEKLEHRIENGVYRGAKDGTAQAKREHDRNVAARSRVGR